MNVNPAQTYQTMTGFGASLTQSGATAIAGLTSAQQTALMNSLFSTAGDNTGAGISFLRQPMGASDFRTADYTYDKPPAGTADTASSYTDYSVNANGYPALTGFSISPDTTPIAGTTSIMSLLQQAQTINPNLSIMGSPWTAPGWMKTGTATNIVAQTGVDQYLYGGTLVAESAKTPIYETYAQYFVRYVQAYAAQGVHVSFITPQNEPYYDGSKLYPAMTLTTAQQVSLITAIGSDFATEVVNPALPHSAANPYISQYTKIEMLDHNWSDAVDSTGTVPSTDITSILGSPTGTSPSSPGYIAPSTAAQYVSGVAFHGYGGGNVSAQNVIKTAYPAMGIYFTEQTGSVETTGTVQGNFAGDLMYDMQNLVVGGTRDWASTITKFNLALYGPSSANPPTSDPDNNGPKIQTVQLSTQSGTSPSGDETGRGLVTINPSTGAVSYNEEYYALGQIAKFVEPGAVRIGSDWSQSVAFLNPDTLKTMVVVAYNNASSSESYQFNVGSQYFTYTIPTDSVVTFSWSSLYPSTGVNVCETTGDMSQLLKEESSIQFVPEPMEGAMVAVVAGLVFCRRPCRRSAKLLHS